MRFPAAKDQTEVTPFLCDEKEKKADPTGASVTSLIAFMAKEYDLSLYFRPV